MNQPNVGEDAVSWVKRKSAGNPECHSSEEWERIAYRPGKQRKNRR